MGENLVTQGECSRSMERIHIRTDNIEKIATQIETSSKNIEKCVTDMKNLMYGSEKADGIITKVSNLWQRVNGIYWLGSIIIIALIGTLTGIMFKNG